MRPIGQPIHNEGLHIAGPFCLTTLNHLASVPVIVAVMAMVMVSVSLVVSLKRTFDYSRNEYSE